MDAMSQPGNPAEAERTADTAASSAPQPQQQANGLQQQQTLPPPAASWGQMWNQLQALSGFPPRLGVLLQVRRTELCAAADAVHPRHRRVMLMFRRAT